jgi:hypothetical protein
MRRTVGKALVAGTAAVLATVLVPAASAAPGSDTVQGGCYVRTMSNGVATNGQHDGVIGVDAVMVAPTNTPDANGDIACKIQVNGVDAPGTQIDARANAAGAVQGQQQIAYDDEGGTLPSELCENDISSDGTMSGWYCNPSTEPQVPPQQVRDLEADGAYCPYGSITGTGNWTPAETTVVGPHAFVWDTHADCTGTGDDSGHYDVVFTGSANDACTAGNGSGTLSGTGPEGVITGSFTFYRGGIHLYVSGSFFSGGEVHNLQYWIDVLASTGAVCSYSTAPLLAHGAIVDSL